MAVKVELFPGKLSYFPGDIVSAFVQVINEFPSATGPQSTVHVSEVLVEAYGLERVDPNWISKLHQPDAPVQSKDSRKIVRKTFGTESTRLVHRALLPAGAAPMFLIKFRLPMRLPCTFKGSSVRYSYHIQAKVTYRIADETSPPSSVPSTPAAPRRSTSDAAFPPEAKLETAVAETTFTVWPSLLATQEKHIARTSSSLPPVTTADIELPLQDYNVGSSLSKITWEGLSGPEVAMIMAPTRKPAPASPPLKHRHSVSSVSSVRDSEVETILNHVSDSDAESSIIESKAPHSPSSHTPRSSFIVRSLTSFRSYNLRIGQDTLLRFTLQPPLEGVLEPGNTFGGVLDFRGCMEGAIPTPQGTPSCMHVTVLLETEEIIAPECRPVRATQPAVIRKLYSEQQELTADALITYFHFTIPSSAPPSFRTPMVSLQWVLRFEILTGVVNVLGDDGKRSIKPLPDSLVWSLPLVVNPPVARS